MNWASLFGAIVALLGPILKQLLDELFKKLQPKLSALPPAEAAPAINELFDGLVAETNWYDRRRRRVLAEGRRVALKNAAVLASHVRVGAPAPFLSSADERALAAAVNL